MDALGNRSTSGANPKTAASVPPIGASHLTLWIVNGGWRCLNPCTGGLDELVTNLRSRRRSAPDAHVPVVSNSRPVPSSRQSNMLAQLKRRP